MLGIHTYILYLIHNYINIIIKLSSTILSCTNVLDFLLKIYCTINALIKNTTMFTIINHYYYFNLILLNYLFVYLCTCDTCVKY